MNGQDKCVHEYNFHFLKKDVIIWKNRFALALFLFVVSNIDSDGSITLPDGSYLWSHAATQVTLCLNSLTDVH